MEPNNCVRVRSAVIEIETQEEVSTRQQQTTQAADNVLKSLSPLINSMRLFGLYFSRKRQAGPSGASQLSCQALRCRGWNPARIYATFIFVATWLNVSRYCITFSSEETFGVELVLKLCLLSNVLLIVVLQTSYYVACHTGSLERVLCQVKLPTDDIYPKYSHRAKVVTAISWIVVVSNVTAFSYILITDDYISDPSMFILLHLLPGYYAVIMKVFLVVLDLHSLSLYVFPQVMNYIVVSLLCDQFDKLNKEFSKCIGDRGEFHGNFEQFRQLHQTISHSVKEADRFLMISNFACFLCHMMNVIVVLFCLIFYREYTVEGMSMHIYWLGFNAFGLSLASGLAIIVNNMVCYFNRSTREKQFSVAVMSWYCCSSENKIKVLKNTESVTYRQTHPISVGE